MDVAKSFWSILVPWHGEFIVILIYIVFVLFFLVQTFLILSRSSIYKMKYTTDYDYIFLGTLGITVSLFCTLAFLIFYSMSEKYFLFFSMIDFMGKIIMVYFYTFAFIAS